MDKLSQSANFLDLGSLDSLRAQAQKDEKGALQKVAQQFESIFMQMLLKSMRDANEAFKSDSPFNTQYTQFYEQMRDQQLSVDLSNKGVLGIADILVRQLSPETSGITPASRLQAYPNRAPQLETKMTSDSLPLRKTLSSEPMVNAINAAVTDPALTFNKRMIPFTDLPVNRPIVATHPPFADAIGIVISGQALPEAADKASQKPLQFTSREDFVTQLYPHAQKAAQALGTKPEVLIAQSALETGWGQKIIPNHHGESSHNLFNIKADSRWEGHKTRVNTLEFEQGVAVKQRADFRVYQDVKQSFDDFVSFITEGERYQVARKVADNPIRFIQALQDAGYATDPHYAQKVSQVMSSVGQMLKTISAGADQ